jgi:hypothetical protein
MHFLCCGNNNRFHDNLAIFYSTKNKQGDMVLLKKGKDRISENVLQWDFISFHMTSHDYSWPIFINQSESVSLSKFHSIFNTSLFFIPYPLEPDATKVKTSQFLCSTVVNYPWSFIFVFFKLNMWTVVNYRRTKPAVVNYRWGQKGHLHMSLGSIWCQKSNFLMGSLVKASRGQSRIKGFNFWILWAG